MIAGDIQGEAILDNRELELYTSSTILSPGEKAQVLALLPANWGKSESGVVWETSGGKYAEQTLGFRIIPWTKRLNISVQPEREETEPLKPFKIDFEVKDANGDPSPDTELTVTIVDRAVYAVQQEFRPGIFDFFYPLPRLNLATFYSDAHSVQAQSHTAPDSDGSNGAPISGATRF